MNEVFEFLNYIKNNGPSSIRGKEIGTTAIHRKDGKTIVVDTCYVHDMVRYETGIKVDDDSWIIVEGYSHAEEAKEGHNKWCEYCRDSETLRFPSIQFDYVYEY